MFNRLATQANQVPEPPPTHARAPSESARAEQLPAPGTPYQPYSEQPALSELPYEPYGEKPALDEHPYEPYKGI
jgi:hypothetical protein